MAFAPSTTVRLLSVPFESDYKNVLYYSSRAHQTETLMGMTVRVFKDFTYQRKEGYIGVPAHIDTLWNCNYVMYQNENYTNKWFYAFITKMEYINDGLTRLYIETDVYNTWCFDVNIKPSFVEREHVQDDSVGANTIPENLETGDFIVNKMMMDPKLNSEYYVVIGVTRLSDGTKTYGGNYGGIQSGARYYAYIATDKDAINSFINRYDGDGFGEALVSMFILPKAVVGEVGTDHLVPSTTYVSSYEVFMNKPTTVDGYTPRNKKLLTSPFTYLEVTNGQGSSMPLRWELFKDTGEEDGNVKFTVRGTICPGGSIRLFPYNYNITTNSVALTASQPNIYGEDYGINAAKFPICSWNNDVYLNWLTQNSVNLAIEGAKSALNLTNGALNTINSDLSNGKEGQFASGFWGIANVMAQIHTHNFTSPAVSGNLNAGDVMYSAYRNTFYFKYMSIMQEYAKSIDEFFDMYGYAVHRVKTPNKGHRSRYWFTKTVGLNCDGAVPQEDLTVFKSIYNNGVTFWRNPTEIENYSLSNVPLANNIY